MINISLQRNDNKDSSDTVSYTDDTIILNGMEYIFDKGNDVTFVSSHGQISSAYRDSEGVLCATVLVQYNKADKDLAEYDKESFIKQQWSTDVEESIDVEVETTSEEELVDSELAEVDAEMQAIRDAVLEEMINERLGVTND